MEYTSVEDFQDYHKAQNIEDVHGNLGASAHIKAVTTGDIQSDPDHDDDSNSLAGSAYHSSSPDEAVFDQPSRTSSPRTSNGSDDEISVLESHHEFQCHTPSPFTSMETRSPFRHPSSVRAMQMDTTPPHLISPSLQQRHRLYTPTRKNTPRAMRSQGSITNSHTRISPSKKVKKEYPLVLLHVTLLPIPLAYSQETVESVLPASIFENWKLLQEKATETVLERGILIPHPREDYDLLEERLLESLELKIPRILKCGHFHLSPEEEADVLADSENEVELDDADICVDCGRRIRDGKYGSAGTGSKRWDIKLFAANGLMRAGAWTAAWREMERVDVEILPWMEEDMKRELELRKEEEERVKAEAREEGVGGLDDERLREIYGGDPQAYVDGLPDTSQIPAPVTPQRTAHKAAGQDQENVPLWDLFRDHMYHVTHDRRNIAIFLLSILVIFLSMGSFSQSRPDGEAVQNPSKQDIKLRPQLSEAAMTSESKTSASTPVASVAPSGTPLSAQLDAFLIEDIGQGQGQESLWKEPAEDVLGEMIED